MYGLVELLDTDLSRRRAAIKGLIRLSTELARLEDGCEVSEAFDPDFNSGPVFLEFDGMSMGAVAVAFLLSILFINVLTTKKTMSSTQCWTTTKNKH